MEDYKLIPGFDHYSVHRIGYVLNDKTGRVLKPNIISKGYCSVTLSNKKTLKREYIHRLVAQAFIANPENKKQVNHINGVMTDNRVENLEWATAKENINHAYRIGLCPTSMKAMQAGKLKEKQVLEIRRLLNNRIPIIDLSKIYDVTAMTIYDIRRRKTWDHI